jgi:hypothetical protein
MNSGGETRTGISTLISRVDRAIGMTNEEREVNVVSVWYGIGTKDVGYGKRYRSRSEVGIFESGSAF